MKSTNKIIDEVRQEMAAGNFQAAARACSSELAVSPSHVPLLALLTAACEHAGDVHEARKAALRWVQAAPLDAYAHYKLAMLEQRLQHYRTAVERLKVAMHISGPDDEVRVAAAEAMHALEALQLQQITALREVDICFRLKLNSDPVGALVERGFHVSRDALQRLQRGDDDPRGARPRPAMLC